MRVWGCWWLGPLALCGACYSMTVMQEPKPLPQGAVRGSLGLGVNTSAGVSAQLASRVGLGLRTEARLKLSFAGDGRALGGTEAGLNCQPYDAQRVGLFLMPHYRYYAINDDDVRDDYYGTTRRIHAFAIPMLAVFHLGWYELFVGPDLHAGTREQQGFLGVGGHVGGSVAASRFVHLTLETGLIGTVAGIDASRDQYGDVSQSVLTVGDVQVEVGFSVSVGSPYRR